MFIVKPLKVGLVFGAFAGAAHVVWSIFVAIGFAQPLLDFILTVHMIEPTVTVLEFDLLSAVTLVIVTSIIGYIFGSVVAVLWNYVHNKMGA